jgi:hypothetical protein
LKFGCIKLKSTSCSSISVEGRQLFHRVWHWLECCTHWRSSAPALPTKSTDANRCRVARTERAQRRGTKENWIMTFPLHACMPIRKKLMSSSHAKCYRTKKKTINVKSSVKI